MKKKVIALILVFNMFFYSGCWSRSEIEDLALVTAIGIDEMILNGEEMPKMSLLIIRPSQLGVQSASVSKDVNPEWLVSDVGSTLYDAMRKIYDRSPRNLKFYHNQMIIIGEKSARSGLDDVFDFFQRQKDIRPQTWIFICRGEAAEVMKSLPEFESTLSKEVSEMITNSITNTSDTFPVDLLRLSKRILVPGWDSVLPVIRIISPREVKGSKREEKEADKTVMLEGVGVFQKGRLVGFMGVEETTGFLYLADRIQRSIITFKHKAESGREFNISAIISNSSSKTTPVFKDGRLMIEVEIKANADIVEVQSKVDIGDSQQDLPLSKPETIKHLNSDLNQKIKLMAQKSLDIAQKKYKADIYAFGRIVHQKYPDYWKKVERDWYEIYPEMPINIKVDARIRSTSGIADPFELK
ncbi:Ger(x)C family spore germination protein [Phosphitispora sp. TUW77]|uniref:Ger(x)C family spore germination protein n=1 Tax=Phosphitispora sp. TUW77 TaxID=3152361 RepID=UPI003AB8DFD7